MAGVAFDPDGLFFIKVFLFGDFGYFVFYVV